MIYPDMPPSRRREIADACCDNFGRTFIENFSGAELAARVATMPVSG